MEPPHNLVDILEAGARLIDSPSATTPEPVEDLKALLLSRLAQYRVRLGQQPSFQDIETLQDAQSETANQALHVIERVQYILAAEEQSSPAQQHIARLGVRDLTKLRTLISIVFRWGVEPSLNRVVAASPHQTTSKKCASEHASQGTTPADYHRLLDVTNRLLLLVFSEGAKGPLSQSTITTTLLNRHLTDILKPCIALGWKPTTTHSKSNPHTEHIAPSVRRILSCLVAAETIPALCAVIAVKPALPQHMRKACTSLLTTQVLRPDGILGLCETFFGQGENTFSDAPFERLNQFARVLCSVPSELEPQAYFKIVVPRVVALLSVAKAPAYVRAAAFTLSRMLASDRKSFLGEVASSVLLPILHNSFLEPSQDSIVEPSSAPLHTNVYYSPKASLSVLQVLLLNTDPSPVLLTSVLSPIASSLYALWSRLNDVRTSDVVMKETIQTLLATWGRVVSAKDGVDILWEIIRGEGGEWEFDNEGEIRRVIRSTAPPPLELLTPEDFRQPSEWDGLDPGSNLLNLRPDPARFTRFLGSMDRPEIASEVLVNLLEAYRGLKLQRGSDPVRAILYLQLIIQMQSYGNKSLLSRPTVILSFIKHVLSSSAPMDSTPDGKPPSQSGNTMRLEDLRFLHSNEEEVSSDTEDSDDEETNGTPSADQELHETSIKLLLGILEANTELSARNAPELNDIFSLLEPLASDVFNPLRSLAREARVVMTARLASASVDRSSSRSESAKVPSREIYQRALKLLQDPILPVRAHGLLLLTELIQLKKGGVSSEVDPALVPGILAVFLEAVQEDDSYIFLNAVKGLAAMVDSFGKDTLRGLVKLYSGGLEDFSGTSLTPNEIAKRIRIGEALGQVIRRCGNALSIYVDLLVAPLFSVVRSSNVPTTLRTSALSLLADCIQTHAVSLLRYVTDCVEGMIDLLQVESSPSSAARDKQQQEQPNRELDKDPSSKDSKLPPLRRAALHFLALVLRAASELDVNSLSQIFRRGTIARAKVTLSYIAHTDGDAVVRVMARETQEMLRDLGQVVLGI